MRPSAGHPAVPPPISPASIGCRRPVSSQPCFLVCSAGATVARSVMQEADRCLSEPDVCSRSSTHKTFGQELQGQARQVERRVMLGSPKNVEKFIQGPGNFVRQLSRTSLPSSSTTLVDRLSFALVRFQMLQAFRDGPVKIMSDALGGGGGIKGSKDLVFPNLPQIKPSNL
ncbi:unnamed protein product [Tilletia laevis]|uniref:Uncharacterized protein n=1 Tax=Tilletia laevis TaxID=157183 RepID=A0A9N8QCT5_9BASI|nr:unnamed protein product [Tilletia laevis]CAD6934037.1 unnamed protein product [Tilletia caries]